VGVVKERSRGEWGVRANITALYRETQEPNSGWGGVAFGGGWTIKIQVVAACGRQGLKQTVGGGTTKVRKKVRNRGDKDTLGDDTFEWWKKKRKDIFVQEDLTQIKRLLKWLPKQPPETP